MIMIMIITTLSDSLIRTLLMKLGFPEGMTIRERGIYIIDVDATVAIAYGRVCPTIFLCITTATSWFVVLHSF